MCLWGKLLTDDALTLSSSLLQCQFGLPCLPDTNRIGKCCVRSDVILPEVTSTHSWEVVTLHGNRLHRNNKNCHQQVVAMPILGDGNSLLCQPACASDSLVKKHDLT